jgi:hypothetical protein
MISGAALSKLKAGASGQKGLSNLKIGLEGWSGNGDKPPVEPPAKMTAEQKYNVEGLNENAKSAYFRAKLAKAIASKNPAAWQEISKKWGELSKDPVTATAQVRQRASFDIDKGKTKLSKDELKSLLGGEYEEFMRLRNKYSAFNTGLSPNSAATMEEFGFDDLAPTIEGGTWEDVLSGMYYKPEYDEQGELYVDTNIPELSHLVKKKSKVKDSIAKQQP